MDNHVMNCTFESKSNKRICHEFCNPEEEAKAYVCKPVTFDIEKFENFEASDFQTCHSDLMDKLRNLEDDRHVHILEEISETV
jgi:hypothetical protein